MRSRKGWLRWLTPGLEVKRWVLLLAVSIVIVDLGVAYVLKDIYQVAELPGQFYYLTLQFLPRALRGLLFVLLWLGLLGFSMTQGRYGSSGAPREES